MDARILTIALVACAVGLASSNQYPAGVDPQSCPDYPNCDNAVLHGSKSVATGNPWASVAPVPTSPNAWDNAWGSTGHWGAPAVPAVSPATQYPAGVNPQSCPNYPNCDNVALHGGAFASHAAPAPWGSPAPAWNTAPNGHPNAQVAPQYPAGVSAQSCPNYPYC